MCRVRLPDRLEAGTTPAGVADDRHHLAVCGCHLIRLDGLERWEFTIVATTTPVLSQTITKPASGLFLQVLFADGASASASYEQAIRTLPHEVYVPMGHISSDAPARTPRTSWMRCAV